MFSLQKFFDNVDMRFFSPTTNNIFIIASNPEDAVTVAKTIAQELSGVKTISTEQDKNKTKEPENKN